MDGTEGDATATPDSGRTDSSADERIVEGIGVTSGIAFGTAHLYDPRPEVQRTTIAPDEVETEISLLDEAVEQAERELETVRSVAEASLGEASEAIFEAQVLMLRDEELLEAMRAHIREETQSAGAAVQAVLKENRQHLEVSDDQYLRERAEDLIDLEHRLLQSLQRGRTAATIEHDAIVLAESLSAADLVRFHHHGLRGCVTERGGATSHVSIVAKALDLPTIVGAEGVTTVVSAKAPVILDSDQGRLVVEPSSTTRETYQQRRTRQEQRHRQHVQSASLPSKTRDGHVISLQANVEFGEELGLLDRYGAEGIGLMRTEMLFLTGSAGAFTEERQVEVYREAAAHSGRHGATIRLLDLGGDRLLPLGQTEDNPFLGWRGIRVLLDRPERLLRPQLRALLRANASGTLRVLLPMVTELNEVRRVKEVLRQEIERLSAHGIEHDPALSLGVMVEVPAVGLQAKSFAEVVDFLSVGTNDLTQYVLAVDRGNDRVADRYDALHPAVLELIARTTKAGRLAGVPVAICGEVAGDIEALPILLGLGVDVLSAAPPYLPLLKRILRRIRLDEARGLADEVLSTSEPSTVRRLAREWLSEHGELDLEFDALPSRSRSTA